MKNSKSKFEKDNFFTFLNKSKIPILIITFFLLLTYGGRLVNNSFSIDTELYMKSYSDNFTWWMSLNRWALVVFNKLFAMDNLLIFQTNFLTVSLILLYSILFNYLFYLHIDKKYDKSFYKLQFIFPIVMLTSPIFAEMYNFAILNTGIAFGICLIGISLILYENISFKENKVLTYFIYLIGITLTTFAFGIYQAIVPLYLLIVAICYLLKCFKDKNISFKWLFKQIILFVISSLAYLIICKIFCPANSYLNSGWSTAGMTCIKYIYDVIIRTLKCETIYYNITYLVAIFIVIIVNIILLLKKKNNIGIVLGSLGVISSPFFINIITGVDQLKRTQFNYPICIGFIFLIFALILYNKNYKYIYTLFIIFVFGVSYKQAMISGNLFYSDEVRFQNDVLLAEKIETMIEEKEWYNNEKKYTLILLGEIKNTAHNSYLKGEVMGHSFFEFDSKAHYGVSTRVPAFMETLGYYYNGPGKTEYDNARKYLLDNEVKSFPNKNCIVNKDKYIYIRLSEDI